MLDPASELRVAGATVTRSSLPFLSPEPTEDESPMEFVSSDEDEELSSERADPDPEAGAKRATGLESAQNQHRFYFF